MKNRKLLNDELVRLSVQGYESAKKTPLVIVLDNVRSLNNIGSVFRTADCYLVEKIVLCGITAQPPHKDIRKTALGATQTVPWSYSESTVDAISELKAMGYTTYAIEQAEDSLKLHKLEMSPESKIAVVLGNEVEGVQQSVIDSCDAVVELEQYGTKHSLNISVCTGIVIDNIYRKLNP